jgi:hypothetical protein
MPATLLADTAADVCGIRAMLEVVPAGCRQGGFQLLGPFVVGLGESPHLIGSQAEDAEHSPDRLAAVDRIQQLLPHLDRELLLRLTPKACPRCVVLRFTAPVAVTVFPATGSECRGAPEGHVCGPQDLSRHGP